MRSVQGRYPVIYDIGMTATQRKRLRSRVVTLEIREAYSDFDPNGFIRATHKPAAIRHALAATGRPCLYLDADVLLTERLRVDEFRGADLVVTPRHPDEVAREQLVENGRINSGLLYFAASEAAAGILERWAKLCATSEMSDQRAMSELLADWELVPAPGVEVIDGLALARLDARIYNDTSRSTGKVLHYKNLGRKTRKRAAWRRTAWLIRSAPWAIRWSLKRRRAA